MAEIGMTKLEAVNKLLATLGHRPHPTLDTGGTSEAALAEVFLDRSVSRIQLMGHPENTVYAKTYTAALDAPSSEYRITVASDVLHVRASGPDFYRRVALLGDIVKDMIGDVTDWGNGTTLCLDVITELTWATMPPRLKELAVDDAAVSYQAQQKGDQFTDAHLRQIDRQSRMTQGPHFPPHGMTPIGPDTLYTGYPNQGMNQPQQQFPQGSDGR